MEISVGGLFGYDCEMSERASAAVSDCAIR